MSRQCRGPHLVHAQTPDACCGPCSHAEQPGKDDLVILALVVTYVSLLYSRFVMGLEFDSLEAQAIVEDGAFQCAPSHPGWRVWQEGLQQLLGSAAGAFVMERC